MDNGYVMERKSHRVLVIPLLRTLNFAVCCVLCAAFCLNTGIYLGENSNPPYSYSLQLLQLSY